VRVKYTLTIGRETHSKIVDEDSNTTETELQECLNNWVSESVDSWFEKLDN
jgi:hypothetical protein